MNRDILYLEGPFFPVAEDLFMSMPRQQPVDEIWDRFGKRAIPRGLLGFKRMN